MYPRQSRTTHTEQLGDAGHPARLALSAGRAVMTRIPLRQAASQGGTP